MTAKVNAIHTEVPKADAIDRPATIEQIKRSLLVRRKLHKMAKVAIKQLSVAETWLGTHVSAFSQDIIGIFQPSIRPSGKRILPMVRREATAKIITGKKSTPLTSRSWIPTRVDFQAFFPLALFLSRMYNASMAARENATSGHTMGTLPTIVKAITLNNKLAESREFASLLQTAMVRRLRTQSTGVKDLGVKQAPFVVLIGADMPSVLTEIAFLTNRPESGLLKQTTYRQQIAQALKDAVVRYQESLKKVTTVAAREREQ